MKKIILLLFLLMSMTAHAKDTRIANPMPPYNQNCTMKETVNVGINFNNISISVDEAKDFMDSKIAEIQAIATEVGAKIDIQSQNYSVYSYNNGGCMQSGNKNNQYQLSGSLSFALQDATQASAIVKKIDEKGYNVNLNANSYRQCQ